MKKLLFLLIATMLYGCDPITYRLVLINETSEKIYYRLFTDTIFNKEEYVYIANAHETVNPNFGIPGINNYRGWEHKVNREGIDSALHIFIFSTDQITEEILKNREYVRLSYKVKELDSMNWTVVYRGQKKLMKL